MRAALLVLTLLAAATAAHAQAPTEGELVINEIKLQLV
jgi:hypothetical protein